MIRISEIRHLHRLSQREFGALFQVSQNTVSQWERGQRGMDHLMILRIADWFGISTDYLLGRDVGGHPDALVYAEGGDGFLYLDVRELTPEQRTEIRNYVGYLRSTR